jgi:hypothetical protein
MMSSLSISENEDEEDDMMRNNYRPPQPIGNRVIRFFSADPKIEKGVSEETIKNPSGTTISEPINEKEPDLTSELSITTEPTVSATFETIDSISPFETIEHVRGSVSPSFKIDEPESSPEPSESSEPEDEAEISTFEANETSMPCSENKDNAHKKGFCPYTFMMENKIALIATAACAVSIPIIIRCINNK